jgi:isocitrate/isopropylmalate dehydrogenase
MRKTRARSQILRKNFALFEPVHGSAPDITGKQIANPCSMILPCKMMLEYFGEDDTKWTNAANAIEEAFVNNLEQGVSTPDLGGKSRTAEVGKAIAQQIIEG